VLLAADGLTDAQMQLVAREVNASETAFLTGGNDLHRPPRLRWFTPAAEVGFCGHATLATAHAWAEALGYSQFIGAGSKPLEFDSAAGRLTLRAEVVPEREDSPLWWLTMPDPSLKPDNTNPMRTCELLGIRMDDLEPAAPIMRTRDDDVILLLKSWQTLVEMKPNQHALGDWSGRHGIRGLCCSTLKTLSESVNVASRFFAPAAGIPEDPVTGSIHGPLAVFLVVNQLVSLSGGRASLTCVQGEPGGRTGLLRVLVESSGSGYRVFVGGMCHTTISGEIRLPTTS
jgi:PhzF family phenazine biosynthesis protein